MEFFPSYFPGLDDNVLDDGAPREIWVGFQSIFKVDWTRGQCESSSAVGAREMNWILVPTAVSGMMRSDSIGPMETDRDASKGLSQ